MAHQKLNGSDIRPRFQQMNRECVAHRMRANWFVKPRQSTSFSTSELDSACGDGLTGYIALEKPFPLGSDSPPIAT